MKKFTISLKYYTNNQLQFLWMPMERSRRFCKSMNWGPDLVWGQAVRGGNHKEVMFKLRLKKWVDLCFFKQGKWHDLICRSTYGKATHTVVGSEGGKNVFLEATASSILRQGWNQNLLACVAQEHFIISKYFPKWLRVT